MSDQINRIAVHSKIINSLCMLHKLIIIAYTTQTIDCQWQIRFPYDEKKKYNP